MAVLKPADTRERILESGMDVFAEHGFRGASSREIGKRAEVNQALVNYHFGSKQKLWEAVCTECGARVLRVVQSSVRIPAVPEEVVDDVVGGLFDAFVRDARPPRILTWAVLQADAMDFEGTAQTFQPLIDLCHQYVDNVQAGGRYVNLDLKILLGLFQGMLVFQIVDQPGHRWSFGKDFTDPDHAQRVKSQLLQAARLLLLGGNP